MVGRKLKSYVKKLLGIQQTKPLAKPVDMEDDFFEMYQVVSPYTMTSMERTYALYQACKYVVQHQIPGDFTECGVWKGGSSMLAALTLKQYGSTDRQVYLYDTFEGMTLPTDHDKLADNSTALAADWYGKLAVAEGDVRAALYSTHYPRENIHFVQGKVEDTLKNTVPERISILRLDTDWYESTLAEFEYLYPLLVPGGVLIIDDYGHWQGARKATAEYFQKHNIHMLLNRIDYTGRIGLKPL